jgi:cytochrome P450
VKDPSLLPGSIPAALRDEFGADSDVITDNLIMVLFAGFETSTGLAVRLLYELARHPEALAKVCCMQRQRTTSACDSACTSVVILHCAAAQGASWLVNDKACY